ncbi:MAG: hypothetical protein ACUZ8H_01905 [Candidatus Anammoxibacter sp.]
MEETVSKDYNGESYKEVSMDNEFVRLAREYLKTLYELTIKFPGDHTDSKKVASIANVDTSTAKRIVEYLGNNKLVCSQSNGCITITMNGMDEIINDNILKYVDTLNNIDDPTYHSQYA